jgi:hypothetical protein
VVRPVARRIVVACGEEGNMSAQGGSMVKNNLEKELRKWREARARKQGGRQTPADRRTLRVNGQEVVVITKPKRALA